ncbi:hypothetical protein VTO42DRAFT_5983 [Malbranchea cinnamomea]
MKCRKAFVASSLRYSSPQTKSLRLFARSVSNAATGQKLENESKTKNEAQAKAEDKKEGTQFLGEKEEGAMFRRLAEMTEQSLLEGSKSARNNLENAGFSEEVKAKLEERIAAASFKSEHSAAFSITNMPASASKETRAIAASAPWTGLESIHDASLRMLNDASKPMRVPFKPPNPSVGGASLKPSAKPALSSGQRLANARQRTSDYALSQDMGLTEKEREAIRNELRERFMPGVRGFSMTVQGLASLANERIEDAMAQGHFRNIPRGKGKHVERDHNANSPYLDTTEYLMNRMMRRQDITPEWIQKQQGLRTEIERFRRQLRINWKRHAAKLIASQGGSLQTQIRRAKAYAAAESKLANKNSNQISMETNDQTGSKRLDDGEHRTQIDHEGRITRLPETKSTYSTKENAGGSSESSSNSPEDSLPAVPPLRDPQYLETEREYYILTIKKLNDMIRSYNLQAPQVSQKPYLILERELDRCYADVAPLLAEEIERRATEKARQPTISSEKGGNGGIQKMLGMDSNTPVYEEDESKSYGFKQFWRDLWGKKGLSIF